MTNIFQVTEIIKKLDLTSGQKLADFGCGRFGFFVKPIAQALGKKGKVYAIDVMRDVIEEIEHLIRVENLPQIEPLRANIEEHVNIENNSVDAVVIINTLFQSEKRLEILREAVRILKSGGKLLIVDWRKQDSPYGPPAELRINFTSLKVAALKAGLELEDEFSAGGYHQGVLFIKL
ncbi:MAG: class I SAM-dependent methyltransferase [Planctomycetes bacterium]|jgi:ubiquinone/menaquinone biosynthesis C-methylase UbiE|nr:class I SAM-dependent methyltransferase [Planctomycetota bacterium]